MQNVLTFADRVRRADLLRAVAWPFLTAVAVYGLGRWLHDTPDGNAATSLRQVAAGYVRADPLFCYWVLLPLLSLVEVRPFRAWLLRVTIAASVIAGWPYIYDAVVDLDWGPTTSTVAISRAAYEGISLPGMQAAAAIGFTVCNAVGLVVALWRPIRPAPETKPPSTISPLFVVLTVLTIVVLTAPDLSWTLAWLKTAQYSPHWDDNNLRYWAYWTSHDRLPLRDFWYPYGGLFLFDKPWPTGPIVVWISAVGRYVVLAVALMMASPGRRWSALLATLAVLAAETSGLNFAIHRYLLAGNVVLAFVAARRRRFVGWAPLLTLSIALVMPLVLEPSQLAYAVPAIGAIVALEIVTQRSVRMVWQGPAFCAVVLLGASIPLLGLLWRHGMLAGTWLFYQRLGDTVEYAAFPATVIAHPWPEFPINSVVAWFPALVMVIGLADCRRADEQARIRGAALVGLAVFDFMVLQKHLIRFMPDTLVWIAFLTGLTFGVLSPVGRSGPDRAGLGAGLGLLAAMLLLQGRLDERLAIAPRLPARLVETLRVLRTPTALAEANAARFAPARFALYEDQRRLVDELTRRRTRAPRLFALTDDPLLYLLTGQPPWWHANLYNGSPAYEQRAIIGALQAHPPDYVVAMRTRLFFDGMPLAVRLPDILGFVVVNYVPDVPVDPFVVLRARRDNEPIPIAFWRDFLGESIDLGMLPARLAEHERPPCSIDLPCDDPLVLEATGPVTGPAAVVGLDVEGVLMTLRVRLRPTQSRYVIPLSRLWPSIAARTSGAGLVAMPPPGFSLRWVPAARPPGFLY
jgi:hypothetical protein